MCFNPKSSNKINSWFLLIILLFAAFLIFTNIGNAQHPTLGLRVDFNYSDGSTPDTEVTPGFENYISLTVMRLNKQVSTIDFFLLVESNEAIQGTLNAEVIFYLNDVSKAYFDVSSAITVNSGECAQVLVTTISASDLEDWAEQDVSASYNLKIDALLGATVDGKQVNEQSMIIPLDIDTTSVTVPDEPENPPPTEPPSDEPDLPSGVISFESGNFNEWDGVVGNPTVVSSIAYSGSYSAYFNGALDYCYLDVPATSTISTELKIYITNNMQSGYRTALIRHRGTADVAQFCLEGDDITLFYLSNNATETKYSYPNLQLNKWYSVKLVTTVSATSGSHYVYLDGSELISVTGIDTSAYGSVSRVYVGKPYDYGSIYGTWYIDDVDIT